jgi:aprataxin
MKLLDAMRDPEMVVRSDELTVTIKDAYPKARHHYLVLPRENIPHLRALNSAHLELLEKMLESAKSLVEEVKTKEPELTFRCGYHASPSMTRLHLHVISQDFDSPRLKHKKHWNSFTTRFFLDAEDVIAMLRESGKIELDIKGVYEPLLKTPLQCHVCKVKLQSMPKLKDHIREHLPK